MVRNETKSGGEKIGQNSFLTLGTDNWEMELGDCILQLGVDVKNVSMRFWRTSLEESLKSK